MTQDLQRSMIEDRGRNILVSAGAGTGKTHVLVERFLSLVLSGEALVPEILALTFTEKAAAEMKSRLLARFRELGRTREIRDLEAAQISTFHAFAARLLKEHPLEAGVDPGFRVMEEDEAELLREQALSQVIERACLERKEEAFPLLKSFEERRLRSGLEKIYEASRLAGCRLGPWLESRRKRNPAEEEPARASLPDPPASSAERKDVLGGTARGIEPVETIAGLSDAGDPGETSVRILQKIREIGDRELESEWADFSKPGSWDWERVAAFQDWIRPFARRGGAKQKDLWKELKALTQNFLGMRLDDAALRVRPAVERLALDFEAAYAALKREEEALDFGDLELRGLELFESGAAANRKLRERLRKFFKFILVDEFQDTNPVQARLVEHLGSGANLFFVGDYKQSIYGFRGASPELFLEKSRDYAEGEAAVTVPLVENFRTEAPLLEWMNACFEKLWDGSGTGFQGLFPASKREALRLDSPDLAHPVEILAAEQGEDEPLAQARRREARALAEKAARFHEAGVPWGEMTVLFQAMTPSPLYERALREKGIPYFVVSGRGFYHQPEIKDLMHFLTVLDQPLLDIPLAALLRSPFFRVSEEALFWLAESAKGKNAEGPLFSAVRDLEGVSGLQEEDLKKLQGFRTLWEKLLRVKDRLWIAELIQRILDETSYAFLALAHESGVRRTANLKKLIDLAREAEARERMTLGDFIRRVRRLETQEIRESEAQIEAEKSGRVLRLMTVHKAKGLEFQVVFAADLAHENRSWESRDFLADPGSGYAFKLWNDRDQVFEKPLAWTELDEAARRRDEEERKRLFYVAVTRAKARLVLSGVLRKGREEARERSEGKTWMDWITALRIQGDLGAPWTVLTAGGGPRQRVRPAGPEKFRKIFPDFRPVPEEELIPEARERERASEAVRKLWEGVRPLAGRPARVIDLPVSAFSVFRKDPEAFRRIYELGLSSPEKREALAEEEDPGAAADFGTRVHRILERMDFKHPEKELPALAAEVFLGAPGRLRQEAVELVQAFIQSPVFSEIRKASKVYREIPFVLNERHGRIHGVIDLLMQGPDGGWRVFDYKTAAGDEAKSEAAGYDFQIKLYGLAVSRLLGMTPSEGQIYFLRNRARVRVGLSESALRSFEQNLRGLQEEMLGLRREV